MLRRDGDQRLNSNKGGMSLAHGKFRRRKYLTIAKSIAAAPSIALLFEDLPVEVRERVTGRYLISFVSFHGRNSFVSSCSSTFGDTIHVVIKFFYGTGFNGQKFGKHCQHKQVVIP